MSALTPIARCSVYFIRNDRSGDVKIGFSTDVRSRLGNLQTSQVDPLSLLRIIDGGPATERWLHRKFAHLSLRGEWFAFDSDMLTIIPPDEVVTPIKVTHRRDVRLSLRERLRDSVALGEELRLSPSKVLLTYVTKLSDDEAARIIAFVERGIASDLSHDRNASEGEAA